ncbi:MAG: transketolase C-terminal domain-containing protein, partial [Bacteroidales bacterium]
EGYSVGVASFPTIKPLDVKAVLESVAKTRAVVVAEEHFIAGGLGELIAGTLAANKPAPVEYVAIDDKFGQSGTPGELMKAYGLDAENIVKAVKKVIVRK